MANEIKIEITPHKLFTKKAIALLNAYAFFALVPILMAIPILTLIVKFFDHGSAIVAIGLCLATLGLAAAIPVYFFPIVLGNPHVRQLVRSLNSSNQNDFIIQLKNLPRAKSGFWALMEDADDMGFLSLGEETLIFQGDSTTFSVPFASIRSIRRSNVGWRGAWIYGNRIIIDISDRSFEFTERFSLSLPASKRISKDLFNRLSAKINK